MATPRSSFSKASGSVESSQNCWVLKDLKTTPTHPLTSTSTQVSADFKEKTKFAAMGQMFVPQTEFLSEENEAKVREAALKLLEARPGPYLLFELFHNVSEATGFEPAQLIQIFPRAVKSLKKDEVYRDWFRGKSYLYWIRKEEAPIH